MLRKLYTTVMVWLLKPQPTSYDSVNRYYVSRLPAHAICMAIITITARMFGWSNGVMASYGFVADVLFNVIVGTLVLHLVDRAKLVVA